MIRNVLKIFASFGRRMQNDHMGAYAATCAYFLMISFVPFFMIFFAFATRLNADVPELTRSFVNIIPSGLKAYVEAIIAEVGAKTYVYVPLSVLILIWSAAKVFHALTNGLNVISRVEETRGWFFLRFRSMFFVLLFFLFVGVALVLAVFGQSIQDFLTRTFPKISDIILFFYSFRTLIGYIALIFLFLFIYKFLPNCYYSFRSQFPGALIVSTVWMFFSYLLSLYYEHNRNFNDTYGSMTSMILAMIWLYFCAYFLLFGAELNRVIYEDPEDNIFMNTLDAVKLASARKQQEIAEELDEHSLWRPLEAPDEDYPVNQPKDIEIAWADDNEEETRAAVLAREAILRRGRMPRLPFTGGPASEADQVVESFAGGAAPSLAAHAGSEEASGAPEDEAHKGHEEAAAKKRRVIVDGGWTAGVVKSVNSGSEHEGTDEKVVNLMGGSK